MHYMFDGCPACGEPIDSDGSSMPGMANRCQGHGEIGDPYGHAILKAHDNGFHGDCDSRGCSFAGRLSEVSV